MPRRRGLHVRQAGKTVLKILAAVSAETRPFSLLTAESIMLGVRHETEGKLRVTYAGWDDAKVVLDGQVLELRWGPQGVEARILPDRAVLERGEPQVEQGSVPVRQGDRYQS